MKRRKTRYSGVASKPFWNRIRAAAEDDSTMGLYVIALHLQDVEARVLQLLEQAEMRRKGKRR